MVGYDVSQTKTFKTFVPLNTVTMFLFLYPLFESIDETSSIESAVIPMNLISI